MGVCSSVLYGPCQKKSYTNDYYSVGLCSMRGSRPTMQDSHSVYLSIPNHPTYSLFGVFDGFNGNEASTYLSNNLINILSKLQTLNDDNIIIDAICNLDKEFLKLEKINKAGSTIVFALIKPIENIGNESNFSIYVNAEEALPLSDIPSISYSGYMSVNSESQFPHIFPTDPKQQYDVRIFWVGDSRSTLITNGNQHEKLTLDHHCDLSSEKKRIIESNDNENKEIIINNKINGITELSRSFGCYAMKNNKKLKYNQQKHVCIAGVTHKLCRSDDTLLLYCDGMIEKWKTKQAVSKYKRHYDQNKDYKKPIENSLNYLCEECIDDGSTDNITVIAVQFK